MATLRNPHRSGVISSLGKLARDRGGAAMVEFALVMPLLIITIGGGIEAANYTIMRRRLSDIAATVADNASRVGERSELAETQLREVDINDVLKGAKLQGRPIDLSTKGRVILSSLEVNADGGQWVRWQRCTGSLSHTPTFGKLGDGSSGTAFKGMGPATARVQATASTAVMFVEIAYDYDPVVPVADLVDGKIVEYSSYAVRDKRDLSEIYNPNPAAPVSNCS